VRWVISDDIEKISIRFFYYLSYRGFVSRVQVRQCWNSATV